MSTVTGPSDVDLGAYLTDRRAAVEAALVRVLEPWRPLLDGACFDTLSHGVLSTGKRLRPVLVVASYEACGGDGRTEARYDLAAAVELIHAYSLMHDDLPCMDDADLRRGRPTTHRVHGEATTIRTGAALIPMAAVVAFDAAQALGCDRESASGLVRSLLDAAGAGGMVGGQALDLLSEGRALEERELVRLHRLKTGALLAASLEIGAEAAGAPAAVRRALLDYGRAIGLAFQIADDVLDATATVEELGKEPSDSVHGKSTYVGLHGLDGARRRAERQAGLAVEALERVGLAAPVLRALAWYVVNRDH